MVLLVSRSIGAVFGGRAVELAGRVIRPEHQANGVGKTMLQDYLSAYQPNNLVTYTRNPAVLKMLGSIAQKIYPLHTDDELQVLASQMPHAETDELGVTYHINRYGEAGLFQGFDPADLSLDPEHPPLKEVFGRLKNIRNALVVAARITSER